MADEEIRMFADSVGRFLDRNAPPERVAKWREDGMVEREFWREAGQAGLLGVSVPEAYGGPGGDFRHDVVVAEAIIRKGVEGFAAGLHNVIITPYIQAHGTEGQKQRWLPKLVERRAGRGDRDERAGRGLGPAVGPHHRAHATATAIGSTAPRPSSPTARSPT